MLILYFLCFFAVVFGINAICFLLFRSTHYRLCFATPSHLHGVTCEYQRGKGHKGKRSGYYVVLCNQGQTVPYRFFLFHMLDVLVRSLVMILWALMFFPIIHFIQPGKSCWDIIVVLLVHLLIWVMLAIIYGSFNINCFTPLEARCIKAFWLGRN